MSGLETVIYACPADSEPGVLSKASGFFLSGSSLPFRQAAADIDFRNGGVIDQIEAFASGRSVADDPVTDLGGAVTDRFQRFFKLRRQSSF